MAKIKSTTQPEPQDQPQVGYYQQLHKDCGGEICIVATNEAPPTALMLCKSCRTTWRAATPKGYSGIGIPADWMPYDPEATGGAK